MSSALIKFRQFGKEGTQIVKSTFRLLFMALTLMTVATQEGYAFESRRDQLIRDELAKEDAGDFAGAIEISKQILRINPRDVFTINTVAGLYGKLGKFAEEIVWAKKAIAIDGSYHLAYINYGNALFYLNRIGEARSAFEKAQSLAPLDPLPVYSLGSLAEELNEVTKAISYFEASIVLDPKFEPALFSLAAMYANTKKYDAAISTLDKLLALNPNADDAKAMRLKAMNERAKFP